MPETLRNQDSPNPVDEYLKKEIIRSKNLEVGKTIWIPTDPYNNGNLFTQNYDCWVTCRNQAVYDYDLFTDEYKLNCASTTIPQNTLTFTRTKDDNRTIEGWSREDLFGTNRVVVDLGSGQAIALLEYAKEFPQTTFIGVDSSYKNSHPVDLSHHGIQLIKDDWGKLELFEDDSVDTFLSVQGGLTWSCEGSKYERTATADNFISAITRVAKEGCFFLTDTLYWADLDPEEIPPKKNLKNIKEILAKFNQYGWERIVLDNSAFFILTDKKLGGHQQSTNPQKPFSTLIKRLKNYFNSKTTVRL